MIAKSAPGVAKWRRQGFTQYSAPLPICLLRRLPPSLSLYTISSIHTTGNGRPINGRRSNRVFVAPAGGRVYGTAAAKTSTNEALPELVIGRQIQRKEQQQRQPQEEEDAEQQQVVSPCPSRFPCIDSLETRTQSLLAHLSASTLQDDNNKQEGDISPMIEPAYTSLHTGYSLFKYPHKFNLVLGCRSLDSFELAYETYGELNEDASNAVLIHTGLSASSHLRSHEKNKTKGWWENVVGPGRPIDTNKFFVICSNVLGGCYGSTGPCSINPRTGSRYATNFPMLTIWDLVRAQSLLLDHLSITKLHASVGASMGGMQALAYAILFPHRLKKLVTISACIQPSATAVALRFIQRQAIMTDPHFARGFYYDLVPPHAGMKLGRMLGTLTYRSAHEFDTRFGLQRGDRTVTPLADLEKSIPFEAGPFCADYEIEKYLDYQGEKFCLNYDPNSLLYLSKAMDMFNAREPPLQFFRAQSSPGIYHSPEYLSHDHGYPSLLQLQHRQQKIHPENREEISDQHSTFLAPLEHGVETLVMGTTTDLLFPVIQQEEIYQEFVRASKRLNKSKNYICEDFQKDSRCPKSPAIKFVKVDSWYGHDAFLVEERFGNEVGKWLDT